MGGLKDIGIRRLEPKHINAGGLILSYVALDNTSNQTLPYNRQKIGR